MGSGKGQTNDYSKSTIKEQNQQRYYCFAKSTDTFKINLIFQVKFTDMILTIIDNNR